MVDDGNAGDAGLGHQLRGTMELRSKVAPGTKKKKNTRRRGWEGQEWGEEDFVTEAERENGGPSDANVTDVYTGTEASQPGYCWVGQRAELSTLTCSSREERVDQRAREHSQSDAITLIIITDNTHSYLHLFFIA